MDILTSIFVLFATILIVVGYILHLHWSIKLSRMAFNIDYIPAYILAFSGVFFIPLGIINGIYILITREK